MDTAHDESQALEEVATEEAAGLYTSDEDEVAIFPMVDSLNDRQFLAVMRDDEKMLNDFLEQHIGNHQETVERLAKHGIVRYEFDALGIGEVYHQHFVKLSLAIQLFSLYERNFSKFVDRCSPLLVAAPMLHLINPTMVAVDRTSPSLRMSVIFQTVLRFACDVTTNVKDARPLVERFKKELCEVELTYNEHCQLLAALDAFMKQPKLHGSDDSVTRQ